MKRHTCKDTQKRFFLEWIFCGPIIYIWDSGTFSTSCWSHFLWPLKQKCPGEWLGQHILGARAHSTQPAFTRCLHSIHWCSWYWKRSFHFRKHRSSQPTEGKFINSCVTTLWGYKTVHRARIASASREMCHQTFHTNHFAGQSEIYFDPSDVDFWLIRYSDPAYPKDACYLWIRTLKLLLYCR